MTAAPRLLSVAKMRTFDANDPGLLTPEETSLLTDQYELAMSASYHRRGMNEAAVFELFPRHLPPHRQWLLVAGLGPALSLVERMRFGAQELGYLASEGFHDEFLDYLSRLKFSGSIEAMPEGTIAFAGEPLVRVTAPRIEAQLLETLLLNQINFQTTIATKAARVVLAAGGGQPGSGERVVDFSPRRDHGIDAAMKVARAAAIAGAGGTSNVAAAMRYGLRPVGTMAHSYVMSFDTEEAAFRSFMEDTPQNAVMLVDTYDTLEGVRTAIAASRATGVPLKGVRLDSGDLLTLSRAARRLLDDAGMHDSFVLASGDLEERQIAALVSAHAPIDFWGVGTDLGTSRDSPALGGVYKLVAHRRPDRRWVGVAKRSPAKATVAGAKQVFRGRRGDEMVGDVIAGADEDLPGRPLLVPAMRAGRAVLRESLAEMRARAASELSSLPERLRDLARAEEATAYPVNWSPCLVRGTAVDGAIATLAPDSRASRSSYVIPS
ncbi:MAG TPA: nicotinate phosphoribosyltransferase [Methylomirabilota bacterium]|jgi:nicotinate phosphoribosyltransferase